MLSTLCQTIILNYKIEYNIEKTAEQSFVL